MGDQHKTIHPLSLGQKIANVQVVADKCPECGEAAVIISEQLLITPGRIIASGRAVGKATSGTRYALCLWCFRRQRLEMDPNGQWKLFETRTAGQETPPEVKQ